MRKTLQSVIMITIFRRSYFFLWSLYTDGEEFDVQILKIYIPFLCCNKTYKCCLFHVIKVHMYNCVCDRLIIISTRWEGWQKCYVRLFCNHWMKLLIYIYVPISRSYSAKDFIREWFYMSSIYFYVLLKLLAIQKWLKLISLFNQMPRHKLRWIVASSSRIEMHQKLFSFLTFYSHMWDRLECVLDLWVIRFF